MRFIVDLYRYLLIGLCGVFLIGFFLLLFLLHRAPVGLTSGLSVGIIASAAAAGVLLILSLGVTAILISLHDRHAALVDGIGEIAMSLEAIARSQDRMVEFGSGRALESRHNGSRESPDRMEG